MTFSTTETITWLATARRVIGIEAQALALLAEALGESFAQAVAAILQARGRVVVSGMGKSGHVGRKIAATLASTGTPAQFVHPAEASHGDLGMVTRDDVLLVLSNSGETPELSDIVAHSRRFSIPLIGVAGRAGSTLLRQADVAILLPAAPEACGTGVVPTTSTTDDPCAGRCAGGGARWNIAPLRPNISAPFTPAARLGARLATVASLMHDAPPLVPATAPMAEALLVMTQKGFGVVGVTDATGRLTGIITDGDLRRHMDGLLGYTAAEVMTRAPQTIAPGALAEAAVAVMNDRKITCLFVLDPGAEGRPLGILHIHDCLRAGVA